MWCDAVQYGCDAVRYEVWRSQVTRARGTQGGRERDDGNAEEKHKWDKDLGSSASP